MKVEDGKIVTFIQTIESEGDILTSRKRSLLFHPGCVGQTTYDAMLGMSEGQEKHIEDTSLLDTPPREDFIQNVPIHRINHGDIPIAPGMQLSSIFDGSSITAKVVSVAEDHVRIDANHPWAGKTLFVNIKILNVDHAPEGTQAQDVFKIESLV